MYYYLVLIFFLTSLTLIIYQDFKDRKVSLVLFVMAFLLGGYLHFKNVNTEMFLYAFLVNIVFILMLSLILALYSKIKMKKSLLNTIGLGDILFFFILAISFPTITFLVLFSISLIFSLVVFLAIKSQLKKKTVPLAGFQALFLSLILILNELFKFVNLYAF